MGFENNYSNIILINNPYSIQIKKLLKIINSIPKLTQTPMANNITNSSSQPKYNLINVDNIIQPTKCIGLYLNKSTKMDTFVNQNYKPLNKTMIVTHSKNNQIIKLDKHNTIKIVQNILEIIPKHQRKNLQNKLIIKQITNEHQKNFDHDDYIIHPIIKIDPHNRCLLMSDPIHPKQTIRIHTHNTETAHKDLALLLDTHQIHKQTSANLVFTYNNKNNQLFSEPNHNTKILHHKLNNLPLTGFFTIKKIKQSSDQPNLHNHAISVTLLHVTNNPQPS